MSSVPNNSNLCEGVKYETGWCLYIFSGIWNRFMEEATTLCGFFILVLYERGVFFVITIHGVRKDRVYTLVVQYSSLCTQIWVIQSSQMIEKILQI